MSGKYRNAVERIAKLLAEAHPDRVVTRTYKDFALRPEADLVRGIYTVLSRGVEGYDYETSDPAVGIDAPSQTELGAFVFTITGQMVLPESEEGIAIENAEFDMLEELERFADGGIADEDLKDLLLQRSVLSQQLETPYAWVLTEWRLRLFD